MNRTHFEHAGYALLMQVAIGLLTGDWLAGACAGAFFFVGREHAQQQAFYKRGDFEAFDLRRWDMDALLDLAFPVVAVAVVWAAVSLM